MPNTTCNGQNSCVSRCRNLDSPGGEASGPGGFPTRRETLFYGAAMSKEEAFLVALREAPDDDALRCIYADWLEERGDPRAEFLRGECLLAGVSPQDARYVELKARLRAMGSGDDL